MCEYCKGMNGRDDSRYLFEKTIFAMEEENSRVFLTASGYINPRAKLKVELGIFNEDYFEQVDINYCPMCGQDLKKLLAKREEEE